MQISSRFTIAIHVLLCIEAFKNDRKVTSDFLASSVNVHPVVIRRLLLQLKTAGIVSVARGSGGAELSKPAKDVTLLDVYNAVECVKEKNLFHFHENPNPLCPVGRNIHTALDASLEDIQAAMENEMSSITLADILRNTKQALDVE